MKVPVAEQPELSDVLSLKPVIGQSTAKWHTLTWDGNSAFQLFCLAHLFNYIFPHSSSILKYKGLGIMNRKSDLYLLNDVFFFARQDLHS